MATNCAAETGEGAGAAFLWTDEVRPDWLLTCPNRPEPTVWRRCDNTAGHPQETKRCSVLRLKSQPRRTACDGKPLKHRTASDELEHCSII